MTAADPRPGVLLVNLGTPDSTSVADVRTYLAEFLNDPLVLDIPTPARRALVHGIILRTRPRKSARAYRTIWSERGSPLKYFGEDLARGLADLLGARVAGVELAMRYRNPSIADALERLRARGTDQIVVVPLFPQYSMAAWASAVTKVYEVAGTLRNVPSLTVVPPFYEHEAFIEPQAALARPVLDELRPDKVVISFHGIPERHILKGDETGGSHCLRSGCCEEIVFANRQCYRAQCFATARALAASLGLGPDDYEVTFQSRLTKKWITPFTDVRIEELAREGVKRVAVLCPSFVADCLETIEEIGIRAAEDFVAAGGEKLVQVPCVNAEPAWIEGLAGLVAAELPTRMGSA